jgi:hypothetical protein
MTGIRRAQEDYAQELFGRHDQDCIQGDGQANVCIKASDQAVARGMVGILTLQIFANPAPGVWPLLGSASWHTRGVKMAASICIVV